MKRFPKPQSRAEAISAIERAMVRIRLSQTRRSIGRLMERELGARLDLANTYVVDVLDEAADEPDREITVGAVAERLGIDPTRASRMVKNAIAAGCVRRVASQEDGRRVGLELTAKGRELADLARRARVAVCERSTEAWSDRDCAEFARLFAKFTAPMEGAIARGVARAVAEAIRKRA